MALAESAFPLNVGVHVDLTSNESFAEAVLFGEDTKPGRDYLRPTQV